MSKISDLYNKGDIKYFRAIHKQKQLAMGRDCVSYPQFRRRLERGMTLRDAIYSPCVIHQRRMHKPKHPIEDNIRRRAKLREENIQILDFDEMKKYEIELPPLPEHHHFKLRLSLKNRFISFFKKGQKRN